MDFLLQAGKGLTISYILGMEEIINCGYGRFIKLMLEMGM
jgi:hypothetical protein